MHQRGYLHRDIKSDNFALGPSGSRRTIYILDLGLSKPFRDPATKQHIPYRTDKMLTGTAKFASINTHMGIEQGRRDDLEGLGYVLLYFILGDLPWHGMRADTKEERYNKIMECKSALSIEELCEGLPSVFAKYMYYCKGLTFEQAPDYSMLKRMFKDYFLKCDYDKEFDFDWNKIPLGPDIMLTPVHSREGKQTAEFGSAMQDWDHQAMAKKLEKAKQTEGSEETLRQSQTLLKLSIEPVKRIIQQTNGRKDEEVESCNLAQADIVEEQELLLGIRFDVATAIDGSVAEEKAVPLANVISINGKTQGMRVPDCSFVKAFRGWGSAQMLLPKGRCDVSKRGSELEMPSKKSSLAPLRTQCTAQSTKSSHFAT